jgi:hypothetical protein
MEVAYRTAPRRRPVIPYDAATVMRPEEDSLLFTSEQIGALIEGIERLPHLDDGVAPPLRPLPRRAIHAVGF